MTLGEIIKKYRKEHDMSMDNFAKKSGMSKSYISLLEKNKHPKTGEPIAPSVQTIKQAASAMGMDFNELFNLLDCDVSVGTNDKNKEKTDEDYYLNPETRRIAQEVYEDENLHMLFDASRNAKPEDIKMAAEILKRMKSGGKDN